MLREQVAEFMDATGQRRRDKPEAPPADEIRLRLRLVMEEAFELLSACIDDGDVRMTALGLEHVVMGLIEDARLDLAVDVVAVADALADIDYVVEGTRQCFGIEGHPIAREVHLANMRKVRDGHVDEHGKFCKPSNWRPPDIAGCLEEQGFKS